jgi:hypothetical protein
MYLNASFFLIDYLLQYKYLNSITVCRWLSWSHQFESFMVATVMEYLCHKWPRICSTCRKHFPVLSSFMTYPRDCNYINTTSATSGAGTANPSGAPEFTPVLSGVRVTRSLVLCMFCRSFFVLLSLWYLQTLLLPAVMFRNTMWTNDLLNCIACVEIFNQQSAFWIIFPLF